MWNQLMELIGGPSNAYALSGSGGGSGGDQSIMGMIFPFLMVFGLIYFLMIRPQQKKQQEHRVMLQSLRVGDNVVASGIYGEVTRLKDDVVTVNIADNVRIRVMRSAITGLTPKETAPEKVKDKPSD